MKTLIIARHGKSSWVNSELKDIDRPLDISGVEGVYNVSNSLKESKLTPTLILSSPATRAIHTALIHARVLDFPEEKIRINNSIYYQGENSLLELITNQDHLISTLMICGHNPTSTNFVNHFISSHINNLQTSGVVQLDFDIAKWSDMGNSRPKNAHYFKRNSSRKLV